MLPENERFMQKRSTDMEFSDDNLKVLSKLLSSDIERVVKEALKEHLNVHIETCPFGRDLQRIKIFVRWFPVWILVGVLIGGILASSERLLFVRIAQNLLRIFGG